MFGKERPTFCNQLIDELVIERIFGYPPFIKDGKSYTFLLSNRHAIN